MNVFKNEPVMIMGLLQAAIAIAVSFGLNLTDQQIGTITAFAALALGLVARSQVTPTGGK